MFDDEFMNDMLLNPDLYGMEDDLCETYKSDEDDDEFDEDEQDED